MTCASFGEPTLRKLAAACFRNAGSLHNSAQLLANHGRGAHAVALAIVGVEEFAKALIYTVAALHPDQRHLVPLEIPGHHLKHRIADWIETALTNTNETAAAIRAETGTFTPWDWHIEVLTYLACSGLPTETETQQTARRETKVLETALSATMKRPILMPATKKNAAFYVDLDANGSVLTPARVESDAAAEIRTLASCLDGSPYYQRSSKMTTAGPSSSTQCDLDSESSAKGRGH